MSAQPQFDLCCGPTVLKLSMKNMKTLPLFKRVYILPLLLFVWFIASFAVTYGIAVYYNHVMPVLPFISDTGTFLPESAIFGQLLNIGSVIMSISVYVRYLHVKTLSRFNRLNRIINTACLYLGILISLGVSVVANFPETKFFKLHLIGTGCSLGFGILFQMMQTFLCVLIYPRIGSKLINWMRIVIVGTSFVCLIKCLPAYFDGLVNTDLQGRNTTSKQPEYNSYMLNVTAEWVIMLFTMIFILTFVYEFRKIRIYEPVIETVT